ncbi:shikimate kinase [[Clostridium] leptum]|uniref:Shikimate kinase n=1 Tax=Solibaculum mannosilyticum TaxID=2780922 RepID=A0A7I8D547_9FIRM|nr:shikimate kinase [Solibaculum mannosilyticum]MCO7137754.1 shikimate kinase [[Clostridium] leptum]BCI61155.1 shikimate kinase [Solibaculum mannosilyticum]
MTQPPIVLCGFMGCGKTTVGNMLAHKLGWQFVDMDHFIEHRAGKTVSQIFDELGEPAFRAMEREAVGILSSQSRLVIATGGGVLTFPENVEVFRKAGCPIVLLDVPPEEVARRLQGDTSRPLLNVPDRLETIRRLHGARLPLYQKAADIQVDAAKSPELVVENITLSLKSNKFPLDG